MRTYSRLFIGSGNWISCTVLNKCVARLLNLKDAGCHVKEKSRRLLILKISL